ncbi:hypothetical protein [Bacillus phage FI_KG-Lek]|nr:hypothetical protein [Bacillus phage FI_KG-Lek]
MSQQKNSRRQKEIRVGAGRKTFRAVCPYR